MDIRTVLRFFIVVVFLPILVIVTSFIVFLSQVSYLSHNCMFLDFFKLFLFSVSFKTFF